MHLSDLFIRCMFSLGMIFTIFFVLIFFRGILNNISAYIFVPLARIIAAIVPGVIAGVAGYYGADNANYALEMLGYSSTFYAIGQGMFFGTIMPVFMGLMGILMVSQIFRFISPISDIPVATQLDTNPYSPTFDTMITVFRTPEELGCALARLSVGWSLLAAPIAGAWVGYNKSIGNPIDLNTVSMQIGIFAFSIFALRGLIIGVILVRKMGNHYTGIFSILSPSIVFMLAAYILEPVITLYGISLFASVIFCGAMGVLIGYLFSTYAPQKW